jgi:hypothetical protein
MLYAFSYRKISFPTHPLHGTVEKAVRLGGSSARMPIGLRPEDHRIFRSLVITPHTDYRMSIMLFLTYTTYYTGTTTLSQDIRKLAHALFDLNTLKVSY